MRSSQKWLIGASIVVGIIAVASAGAQQVNSKRDPNIAASQDFINQAIQRLDAAEHNSHHVMGGHGQKAKELLHQAYQELYLASQAADASH
jgi:hypothetical protein